jgi:arabinofuranosyltransferase
MNTLRRLPAGLLLFLTAYLAYAASFIWRTSFTIGGVRYFSLFDDAMISMRYARNLAEGHGLVWNAGGPRVEGITNPLWTLYMAGVHLLPVPEPKMALVIQVTSALLLAANLCVVWHLALRLADGGRGAAWVAAGLTATYLPLNNWALQGMEVGLLALMISVAALIAVRGLEDARVPYAAYLVLGVATLVRPDAVVPLLALTGVLALLDRARAGRHALTGGVTLLCFVAAQTVARLAYYGDPLPNTYYLKMTGYPVVLRIVRGAWVLMETLWYMNPVVFALPCLLLLLRRDRGHLLLGALVAGQAAYSVYVGGDAWEWWGGANRYIAVAAPLFMVLLALALSAGYRIVLQQGWLGLRAARLTAALVIAFTAISLNALKGPRSLPEFYPLPPMHVEDNARMARAGVWLRQNADPHAVLAVRWAGTTPYFSHLPAVDLLGKSDVRVARRPMYPPAPGFHRFVSFYPGHLKWDYGYSLAALRPDLIASLDYDDHIRPYLAAYRPREVEGITLYVRADSDPLRR